MRLRIVGGLAALALAGLTATVTAAPASAGEDGPIMTEVDMLYVIAMYGEGGHCNLPPHCP